MIKHIVLIKLREDLVPFEHLNAVNQIKEALEALPQKIDVIKYYEVGVNVNPNPKASEIAIISEFENFADLNIYREHPEHKKVLEIIDKYKKESSFNDFLVNK